MAKMTQKLDRPLLYKMVNGTCKFFSNFFTLFTSHMVPKVSYDFSVVK